MALLVGSKTRVVDNSGALLSECIEIYDASKYRGAITGDLILVAVKRVIPNRKVKKGDLAKALLVRSKSSIVRYGAHRIKSNDSAVVLLNNTTLLPRAKRAKSVVLEEVRNNKTAGMKVLSIAPVIV